MFKRFLGWFSFWKEMKVFFAAAIHPRTPLPAKLVLFGAMAYVILPLDFIPDVLPIIGQTDDMIALITAVLMFVRMTQAIREKLRTAQK